jgi:hypothetical protein
LGEPEEVALRHVDNSGGDRPHVEAPMLMAA